MKFSGNSFESGETGFPYSLTGVKCRATSVAKNEVTSPLDVFLKYGQLDFVNSSDSISDHLTLIFLEHFWIS